MALFFVSYDLNGVDPTHAEMDQFIARSFTNAERVLETVWMIHAKVTLDDLRHRFLGFISEDDRLLVVEAYKAVSFNLLVRDSEFDAFIINQRLG